MSAIMKFPWCEGLAVTKFPHWDGHVIPPGEDVRVGVGSGPQ